MAARTLKGLPPQERHGLYTTLVPPGVTYHVTSIAMAVDCLCSSLSSLLFIWVNERALWCDASCLTLKI